MSSFWLKVIVPLRFALCSHIHSCLPPATSVLKYQNPTSFFPTLPSLVIFTWGRGHVLVCCSFLSHVESLPIFILFERKYRAWVIQKSFGYKSTQQSLGSIILGIVMHVLVLPRFSDSGGAVLAGLFFVIPNTPKRPGAAGYLAFLAPRPSVALTFLPPASLPSHSGGRGGASASDNHLRELAGFPRPSQPH